MNLNGKVSLVTGGAKRLGRAIALELARAGSSIALHYNQSEKEAGEARKDIVRLGCACRLYRADLSKPAEVESLARRVLRDFKACDVLVNSAAVFPQVPLEKASQRDFDWPYEVNLRAPALLTKALGLWNHRKKRDARVINIGDVGGALAWPGALPYSLSKAGLLQLTRASARRLAPHVLVNCVAPGPMVMGEGATAAQKRSSLKRTLLKRLGGAHEVARAVRFLAESDYITGAILPVDGGRTLAN